MLSFLIQYQIQAEGYQLIKTYFQLFHLKIMYFRYFIANRITSCIYLMLILKIVRPTIMEGYFIYSFTIISETHHILNNFFQKKNNKVCLP